MVHGLDTNGMRFHVLGSQSLTCKSKSIAGDDVQYWHLGGCPGCQLAPACERDVYGEDELLEVIRRTNRGILCSEGLPSPENACVVTICDVS